MPRKRRPGLEHVPLDLSRVRRGVQRTEWRDGNAWQIQHMTPESAVKDYICPGCHGTIAAGVAHLVAWRADDVRGDAAGLADRRHWHEHCWRVR